MFPLESFIALPLFLVLGLVMGSFGNVVIGRVPQNESLGGRSHCPKCGTILSASHLVPVFSWMFLRGKCAHCRKSISIQYPVIELCTGVLFVLAVYLSHFLLFPSITLSIVFWAMLLIAVIDLHTQLIPDALTLMLAASAVAYQYLLGDFSLIPAIIGIGFFGLQWVVSRGMWIGSGDVFLAGALGLLFSAWQMMVVSLFLAYILGALIAVILLITGRIGRKAHLSFGPFLILGAFVVFVWGNKIVGFVFP